MNVGPGNISRLTLVLKCHTMQVSEGASMCLLSECLLSECLLSECLFNVITIILLSTNS